MAKLQVEINNILSILTEAKEFAKVRRRDETGKQEFVGWLKDEIDQLKHLKNSLLDFRSAVKIIQREIVRLWFITKEAQEDASDAKEDLLNALSYATAEQLYELKDVIAYKNDEKNDSDRCSVCLNEREQTQWLVRLRCGHRFHKECFEQLVTSKIIRCALCRKPY